MASPEEPAWLAADDDTLNAILSVLHEDARQVKSTSKGKGVEGAQPDADIALQLYTEELDRATTYVSDRIMTKSVQTAVQTDTNTLLQSEYQENVARMDRTITVTLSTGGPQRRTQVPVNNDLSTVELEAWEKLKSAYITGTNEVSDDRIETTPTEIDHQPEGSSWAASRGASEPWLRTCVACRSMHEIVDLVQAPCKHEYCRECLETLVQLSISDESLFPPRCCRVDIPVGENRLFLGNDLVDQFMEKSIEFTTSNRIYCYQPICSAFIPPPMIKDGVAPCPKCKAQTCVICKEGIHGGDCPYDTGLHQVLEVARQGGVATLFQLLYHGRAQYSCVCRAEFCYLCGAPWKTCTCVYWEEGRLYERAEEIYNRDHRLDNHDPIDNPVGPAVGIDRIAEHLRGAYECHHEHWMSRRGPRNCENCYNRMPFFIYECRQCNLMACRHCRYNRL